MAVTLKDIAQRAGVSVSTVSRIINNDTVKSASPETAAKVWKIIHELEYKPNLTARQLILGDEDKPRPRRKSLGCILASATDTFADPFFSEVIAGIYQETANQGFVMEYTFSVPFASNTESAFFNNIVSRKIDGAVMLGRISSDMLSLLKSNIPHIVYCGLNYFENEITQVICDAYKGTIAQVEYLISLGHKKIGFLGYTNREGRLANERRYQAYAEALRKHGLPLEDNYAHDVELTLEGSYNMMKVILDEGKQLPAYCCANDVTALGAMRAIQERGLRVPEDISLIGIDDIHMASYTTPSLTTIRIPKHQMGELAARTLIDQINHQSTLTYRIDLPFELITRESCCKWQD